MHETRYAALSRYRRDRRFQNDSEHSLLVGSSEIGMNRLSLAYHRSMPIERANKGFETPITINVIDDKRSTCRQHRPNSIQFVSHISFTVQTVMDKKMNGAEVRKQLGKT